MKAQVITSIVNGKLKRNLNTVLDIVNQFNGMDVLLTFEKPKKKRSNPQNSYYWGVLIPITKQAIKNEWGETWTVKKTHEYLKENFCFYEKVNEKTGQIVKVPKSTTENTTTEMEVYHLEIRKHLLEWFNVDAPEPNENLKLNL